MPLPTIPSKLPHVGTTIFTVMSKLANEHKAVNLSQGFPDFDGSSELIKLVHHYMQKGMNQYAPMAGLPQLTEQIAQKVQNSYAYLPNAATDITITAGGTQALYTALTALLQPNDEVIVFEPCYDSYQPAIVLSGAKVVPIVLQAPDFAIPWQKVAIAITEKTRCIIINSPHNPSGTVLSAQDLEQLSLLIQNTNIIVLSDEVYEHLVFDQQQHQSVLQHPILRERSFVVFSFGKTFHFTGWKVGYCIAPDYLMREFRKVHQFLVFSVNTPVQYALADYLQNPQSYHYLPDFYQEKRDYFWDLMQNTPFKGQKSSGTYFQLLDYSAISDLPDTEFAIQLTQQIRVASIPISVFYSQQNEQIQQQKLLRFCFAKRPETLAKAAEYLRKLL